MDFLVDFRQKLAREEFEDVIKVLWAIWENRNRQGNNQPYMNGARLLEWVFNSYPREISGKECLPTMHPTAPKDQWQAPPVGTYCVHCDAAIQPDQAGVGLGYIWRDWLGNIVSAGMHYLHVCCTVPIAEAKAVITALQNKPKNLQSPYEIRSDCKQLVEEILAIDSSTGDIQLVVNQIKRHPQFSYCTKFKHVNNAATVVINSATNYGVEEYSNMMNTNVESPYHLSQLAHPLLKASTKASIVFISSIAGAINQITKNFACEWAKDGIRTNSVAPWGVRTRVMEVEGTPIDEDFSAVFKRTPILRLAEPNEISSLV
ncbi:hypothetical protein G4B88_025133 [Cannabis sativa]|uniref:Uncharacterized protein n=2 Tax=Cannabis sativa TaxID=3483 RepID=A0A7J6EFC1_CANSA|nr:hypothetical protein G4B88_025133 [Cannabis sativa]